MTIIKKKIAQGLILAVAFWTVFSLMFLPLFEGKNAFDASDKLFNSISKGSTHYIPKLNKEAVKYKGKNINLNLAMEDEAMAKETEIILNKVGFKSAQTGTSITLNGDLGKFLMAVLKDSDDMFYNRGNKLSTRYGLNEKNVMFVWWNILKAIAKELNKKGGKENFATAKLVNDVSARGIEVAYNYYGIQPESVASKAGILTSVLVFYVIYTLWWGFAIFFLAEGAGLKLEGGHKNET